MLILACHTPVLELFLHEKLRLRILQLHNYVQQGTRLIAGREHSAFYHYPLTESLRVHRVTTYLCEEIAILLVEATDVQ